MKAKHMQTKDIKNFKMSDDVYKLRRKVIEHIYELRHLRLPRVEVRIGEARHSRALLGQASLKDRKVWITKAAINMGEKVLRNVVFHELVHAIYGFNHDEKCPLMQAKLETILSKENCIEHFTRYHKKFN